MSDASTTTTTITPPAATTTPAPQPNTPEARTLDGTLKDQTAPLDSQTTDKKLDTTPETKADDKPVVPDTYTDFKVPEGFTLNKDSIAAALPVFKELGLTQDQAQKLVDLQTARETELAKAGQGDYALMREGWRKDTLANPELSAGGKIKPDVLATIGRAIDGLNNPKLAASFRQAMDSSGIGDHPAFVETFYQMAKQNTEGRPVSAGGPSPLGQTAPNSKPASVAAAMYPNLK